MGIKKCMVGLPLVKLCTSKVRNYIIAKADYYSSEQNKNPWDYSLRSKNKLINGVKIKHLLKIKWQM